MRERSRWRARLAAAPLSTSNFPWQGNPPMSEAGILVPQSKANVSNPEPAPRILIIDDEAAIRESLETLLVLEGYVVDLAPEGQAGLRAIDSQNYDLVLLDL